jgi:hypothetical protein
MEVPLETCTPSRVYLKGVCELLEFFLKLGYAINLQLVGGLPTPIEATYN